MICPGKHHTQTTYTPKAEEPPKDPEKRAPGTSVRILGHSESTVFVDEFFLAVSTRLLEERCDEFYDRPCEIYKVIRRDFKECRDAYYFLRQDSVYVFGCSPTEARKKFPEYMPKQRRCLGVDEEGSDCPSMVVGTPEVRYCEGCRAKYNHRDGYVSIREAP
jgi:hypothetical protein